MRVFFIIPSLDSGGAERVTANLANHWAGKGWQITIITFAARDKDFYELHSSVRRIELNLADITGNLTAFVWKNYLRLKALRHLLQKEQPDFAVSMMTEANVLLAMVTVRMPCVCAIGSERIFPPLAPLGTVRETLRRYSYGQLAAVVALTKECAEWLRFHTNVRRVAVVPNAVTWPLPGRKPRLDPFTVCSSKRRLLLATGRLSAQKNCEALLDVFAGLAKNHLDWDLVFIGEGPERQSIESKVKALGLDKRVFLPGLAGNVKEWYERADIYVMTSRFEGFPNSLAEAMAHGLPAVSFDCDTGPRDIIRHEIDGLLVRQGDTNAFAEGLKRLMNDDVLRKQFSVRAVETRERFSMERIVGMWEKLFMEVKSSPVLK